MDESYYINKKPPLGVMPEKIWKLKRCQDLSEAIYNHINQGCFESNCVSDWVSELNRHMQDIKNKKI